MKEQEELRVQGENKYPKTEDGVDYMGKNLLRMGRRRNNEPDRYVAVANIQKKRTVEKCQRYDYIRCPLESAELYIFPLKCSGLYIFRS